MKKKKKPLQPLDVTDVLSGLYEGFGEYLQTEEGLMSMQAVDDIHCVLEGASVDTEDRKIIWADGSKLGIEETAKKIHGLTGTDIKALRSHVVGWLEMGYVPAALNEHEILSFESAIEEWIADFKQAYT